MKYQVKLLLIWMLLAGSVFAMSYFYPNGRMSSDSYSYLKLAQNMLDGDGLYLKDAYEVSGVRYYAQWPPGYGLMIAFVSVVTGIKVFWSAKIVNVIMLGLIIVFLGRIYKKEASTMALIFLLASPLNVVSMTWSEPAMILGLLLFSEFLYRLYITPKWRWVLALVAAYGWIFFTRYVGAFTLLVVGCVAVIAFIKKRYKLGLQSIVVGMVGALVSAVYLWHNIVETGFILGRAPASNDLGVGELLKLLIHTLLSELNLFFDLKLGFWGTLIPIFFILFLAVVIHRVNRKGFKEKVAESSNRERAVMVAAVGMSQILAATYLLVFPGVIDNRYLMPVLVLGLIGLTDYLKTKPALLKEWKQLLVIVVLISWTVNVPGKIFNTSIIEKKLTHSQTVEQVMRRYENIPAGSLVAFGDKYLEYLRPDLYTGYLAPEVLKMGDREFKNHLFKMTLFFEKSCAENSNSFYVDVNKKDRSLQYWKPKDENVKEFLEKHVWGSLFRVDNCDQIVSSK